jgi:galactose mutarotase-like enzyme
MTHGLVELANDTLAASINPLGAELWSLRDAAGRELMTDADPRWWTGRAPLLFPFVGRLAGDEYRLGDAVYAMPQHGFARRKMFSLIEQTRRNALLRLEADAESRVQYPFDFALDIAFDLAGPTLTVQATVHNDGTAAMPFSFGFHPAFAWPLPYGDANRAHRILFDEPEDAPIRRVAPGSGLIAAGSEPSPVSGRMMVPDARDFERDAIIWDRLASRGLLWGAPNAPNLRIDFPDTPWFALWQKPGAHYLCIEPWAGMADPFGFTGDVWAKPGIMRLLPGETRRFRLALSLLAAD